MSRTSSWATPLLLGLILAPNVLSAADDKPAQIAWLFPAGGQQGKTVEVVVGGTDLAGASAARISGKGLTGKVTEAVGAKQKTLKLAITVAADAELGQHNLYVETPAGMSNGFHFFVGQLPEVVASTATGGLDRPQSLPALPVLINGQLKGAPGKPSDRHFFRFQAKAGQTLVFACDARAILPYIADAVPGWLQAVLTLYDANGKELRYADGFRYQQDTVLFYKVPADGQYLLEIRDSLYRAREDFVYRLSIGALPYITAIYPLGGKRGTTVPVQLHGVNLPGPGVPGAPTLDVKVPLDGPQVLWLETVAQGLASNRVKFDAGELQEISEVEPNDTPQQANRVSVGSVVNGRIGKPGDLDYFTFKAAAKQNLVCEVRARRLGSPLDSVIALFDSQGKKLAQNDDVAKADEPPLTHQADSRLEFTVPADGDYVLRIGDAQRKGGEDYAYRLIIATDRPDFELRLVWDGPQRLAPGETVAATVVVTRRGGYDGEIRLALRDAPKGFVLRGGVISRLGGWLAGQSARVTITVPADAAPGVLTPEIFGTARIDGKEVVRQAIPTVTMKQAFNISHLVPLAEFLVNVAAKQPGFRLATDLPADRVLEVAPGGEVQIPLTALRGTGPGDGAAIALALDPAPYGFSIKSGRIEAGASACTLTLLAENVPKSLRPGRMQSVVVSGTMDTGKEKLVRYAPAVLVRMTEAATKK